MRARLLVCLALLGFLGAASLSSQAADKLVVTVLYFDNNSSHPEYDVMRKGLADMLITDLSGAEGLQVVEREKLDHLLAELKLQRSPFFDPATAQKMGRGIGAQYAITGAFASFEPDVRIDIRLIEVATGKVVMADSVVGARNRFLELEQKLVSKFLSSLRGKFAPPPGTGPDEFSALLKYSKGLDAADHGDLRAASQRLAEVVREAPGFKLAESRYAEILLRIHKAEENRELALSELDKALIARADKGLRGSVTDPHPDKRCRRLSYRAYRSLLPLVRIKRLIPPDTNFKAYPDAVVPQAQWGTLFAWMKEYVTHQQLMIQELKECAGGKSAACDCRQDALLWDSEDRLALWTPLGGLILDTQLRLEAQEYELARFLVLGKSRAVDIRPTLALVDPQYAKMGLLLFENALAELTRRNQPALERQTVKLLEDYAEALLLLGKKTQAVACWQMLLDRFPRHPSFEDYKTKIKQILGATKAMNTVRALRESCSDDALIVDGPDISDAIDHSIAPVEGAQGVKRLLEELQRACSKVSFLNIKFSTYYLSGAAEARRRGDCALYRELAGKARPTVPGLENMRSVVDLYEGVCP